MALGGSLEENVLTSLIWNENLAPHIALHIKPTDFSIRVYRLIAIAALEFLANHRRPARAHINDLLEVEIRRGADGRFMAEVLEQIRKLAAHINEDFVRSSLDRFIEVQRLLNAVNDASGLLHDGNLEQAREILRAPGLQLQQQSPGVWLHDTDQWLRFLREADEPEFYSGIEALDERRVCPARGEIYALLAASGMGKSWFLINVGVSNVSQRKKVLHISLENSLDVTLQRYTQCFLRLGRSEDQWLDIHLFEDRDNPAKTRRVQTDEYGRPATGARPFESIKSLSEAELRGRLKKPQSYGQLLVKYFPTGSLTIGMLSAFLDALEQTDNFKPDLVLLDYLTLMHLDSRDSIRVAIGQLARHLRGMAAIRNFALVTALQANRAAAGKRNVYGSNIAEDWSVHGTCDTFLTYSQTPFERRLGIARILVDKARNSSDRWRAFIQQAYPIGQFCTDSCYHSKQLEEQLSGEDEEEPAPER